MIHLSSDIVHPPPNNSLSREVIVVREYLTMALCSISFRNEISKYDFEFYDPFNFINKEPLREIFKKI